MAWKKGESGNPKGSEPGGNPGAGRPPNWLKERCQEIIDKEAVIEFLGGVVAGKDFEQVVNSEGETLKLPPPLKDRIKAAELLLDRGYGKAGQSVEVSGPEGKPLQSLSAAEVVAVLRAFESGDHSEAEGGSGGEAGK